MDVRQDEVGRRGVQDVERLAAVLRFAHDGEWQDGCAIVQQLAQPMPRGSFVVDDQDAEG
jgi:hypothetical protein